MRTSEIDSEVTGVLLAGGRSSRMGGAREGAAGYRRQADAAARARAAAPAGRPHRHQRQRRSGALFRPSACRSIADTIEGYAGPLAGLHAGIEWARAETPEAKFIASVPIDCPFLPLDLVARLKAALIAKNASCAIAASDGERHPVAGLWRVELAEVLAELAQEQRARAAPLRRFARLRRCRLRTGRDRRCAASIRSSTSMHRPTSRRRAPCSSRRRARG